MPTTLLLTFLAVVGIGLAATLLLSGQKFTDRLHDDSLAVHAAFDQMLVDKGLLTSQQLGLIRHGIRSRGVVTGMRATGGTRDDHREVELDVMVRRPAGGQFAAHETALIPASSMQMVAPGSIIHTYYRPGDESSIAVSVPPS